MDRFPEITAALSATKTDVLGATVTEIERTARTHDLVVTPAAIDVSGISLAPELSAADVVELAAGAGARLLYLDRTVLDADSITSAVGSSQPGADHDKDRRAFVRAVTRLHGFTSRIELGFAHAGIVHTWECSAPWADELEELPEDIDTVDDDSPDEPSGDADQNNRLATELADDPTFRRARNYREYEAAARAFQPITTAAGADDRWRWRVIDIMRQSQALLDQQARQLREDLNSRLAELASSLAATSEFRAAHTADGRREAAQTWITTHHTNGLRMPKSLIGELAAAAQKQPVDQLGLM